MKPFAISLLLSLIILTIPSQNSPPSQSQMAHRQPGSIQCPQQTIVLTSSQCDISYKSCQGKYEIVNCKQKKACVSQSVRNCTQYSWVQFQNTYDCMLNCCDVYLTQPNQVDFTQCIELDHQKMNQAVSTIVSSVAGCIALTIFLCCLYQKICKKRWSNNQQGQDQNKENKLQSLNSQCIWEISTRVIPDDLKRQQCVICLDLQPEAVTSCNHQFHLKCLIEWVKKRNVCPVCINKNINPVRIQCRKCFQKEKAFKISKKTQYSEKIKVEAQSHCGCEQNQ